ncbi:MAG TPA: hypothetical protein VMC06_00660 [Opitutaceae bacterium]|nr:hypothetical protein [Opitutaceae bacterium]
MKNCFFISPIGSPDSPQRKRSDVLVRHLLQPILAEFDFQPVRADQITEPGLISTQVFQHILDDPLLICDLTDGNPNVFYELAVRHITQKPCIHLISGDQRPPFDLSHARAVFYATDDLDSFENTKKELRAHIAKSLAQDHRASNPISSAIRADLLRSSENSAEQALGNLTWEIQELRDTISVLARKIEHLRTKKGPSFLSEEPKSGSGIF